MDGESNEGNFSHKMMRGKAEKFSHKEGTKILYHPHIKGKAGTNICCHPHIRDRVWMRKGFPYNDGNKD